MVLIAAVQAAYDKRSWTLRSASKRRRPESVGRRETSETWDVGEISANGGGTEVVHTFVLFMW